MKPSDLAEHPFLDSAFEIRWGDLTPDHIIPDLEFALERAQKALDRLSRRSEESEQTYENTLLAFEAATEELSEAWSRVNHLDSVSNSPELRKAVNEMLPKVSSFFARIPLDADLWAIIRGFAEQADPDTLTPARRRFLEETVLDFEQHGANLPPEKKRRMEVLESELAAKTQKFSENVLDSTNAWECIVKDPARIRGLPATALENARRNALEKGHGSEEQPAYRFTLHAPSFLPVLKYAEDATLRREIWEAATTIGATGEWENTGLIWDILGLRQEKARLLGHPHFPDLVLQRRMARNGAKALAFVEDLFERTKPAFDRECAELRVYKEKISGEPGPLHPWNVAFYAEKRLHAEYDFNEEALRPYFPIDAVINGLFDLGSRIFGLTIRERPTSYNEPAFPQASTPPPGAVEVWHPEVRFYDLFDDDGRHLGSFYADWHPRESKRSGAWMGYLKTGERAAEPFTPHLGYIMGNLTPGSPGKAALLTHDEVLTIFHEFGHLLHHLCGEVEIKSLNGVNVAWDFVELPSQIMENWCWSREGLDLFARHHETGEPIPEDLFRKMIESRNYMSASAMMRQLGLAKMDLELHLQYADPKQRPARAHEDLDAFLREWMEPYLMPLSQPVPSILRRFTHLFSSSTAYAAGYYSYKWAEVLDADAFSRFQAEGILNPEVGREFRRKILSRGNSEDPASLFRDFMGRDPDPDALLTRSGLL